MTDEETKRNRPVQGDATTVLRAEPPPTPASATEFDGVTAPPVDQETVLDRSDVGYEGAAAALGAERDALVAAADAIETGFVDEGDARTLAARLRRIAALIDELTAG